jgi:glutathione S-transferase
MATIKIHGVPPSTFTRTACMAAHEKGIDYELVMSFPGQVAPMNPFCKIPVLSHGDLTLFETTAILRYLDRTFAGPKLWPEETRAAALCDQWSSAVCDSMVNAALRYVAARLGFLPVPAEMQAKYLEDTKRVVPLFDARLAGNRYLVGETMTAADLFLYPLLDYFPHVPELAPVLASASNCKRWMAAMEARPSAKATVPPQRPQLAA